MDNDQKWNSHFWGKKGLLQALYKRIFAIRRISNHIPKDKPKHIVNKLTYGLLFTHKVRLMEEVKKTKNIKATEIAQTRF